MLLIAQVYRQGTAHLSDTANGLSAEYGFWLGDAFASGGSAGYDHKVEGITAKGAWVCIRHHFAKIGIDPEKDVDIRSLKQILKLATALAKYK